MSSVYPDFENRFDEEFGARADEVCAYVHSLELSDAEWMSGAEYRLWLGAPHTLRVEGTADERLHPFGAEARENGSTWDRAGKMRHLGHGSPVANWPQVQPAVVRIADMPDDRARSSVVNRKHRYVADRIRANSVAALHI